MKTKLLFFVCAAALLFACSEQRDSYVIPESITDESAKITEKKTFVSEEQVIVVAEAFFRSQASEETGTKSETVQQEVPTSIEAIKENVGNPLMYVLNYPNGGFVLVSATRNYYPVLAYSDEGSFELTEDMGPVSVWIDETKEAIRLSDTLDDETRATMQALWSSYEKEIAQSSSGVGFKSSGTPYDAMQDRISELYYQYGSSGWYNYYSLDDSNVQYYFQSNQANLSNLYNLAASYGSPQEYTIFAVKENVNTQQVGPLLTTHWYQESPFNELCPNHYLAGCAAISMAQIMKFHQYPVNRNWNNMPNTGATLDTQTLIRDIGTAVNMNYGPTASGASTSDTKNAFQNTFGYTATLTDHNLNQVKNEILNYQRPVWMRGANANGAGHAWVCDGVKNVTNTVYYFVEYLVYNGNGTYSYSNKGQTSPAYPGGGGMYGTLYLHMNWGWNAYDGWFVSDNISSQNGNYNVRRRNIYVHP